MQGQLIPHESLPSSCLLYGVSFITSSQLPPAGSTSSSGDACLAITGISFVKRDDCDAILVATEHSTGGKVELWELKEVVHPTHKMFSASATISESSVVAGATALSQRITVPIWKSDETFSGPPSRVVSLATPSITLQTGVNAPCFVTVVSEWPKV